MERRGREERREGGRKEGRKAALGGFIVIVALTPQQSVQSAVQCRHLQHQQLALKCKLERESKS
jgi:hypothetical protein